jgi:HAE1 family hydrophobic/amphiphilic exporter-1
LINLKDWNDKQSVVEIMAELEEKSKSIPGANIEFFTNQRYQDYGAAGGFELRLLDKTGSGDYKRGNQ